MTIFSSWNRCLPVMAAALCLVFPPSQLAVAGALLEDLTWQQAEPLLTTDTLVVLPIGAAAKEHGPHLLLKNDYLLAEYLKRRLLVHPKVVIAPTVNYNYYPAFTEYPGSSSLRLETARNLIVDICRSLSHHGPRRFYALNTGISTERALELASALLLREGIVLTYTDWQKALAPLEKQVLKQQGGSHADESETSMMLYINPAAVNMSRAQRDYHPKRPGGFTRNPDGQGTYSPTGAWGDPTLATTQKGQHLIEGLVQALLADLQTLERTPIPAPSP
jgi:creatinine amidohydrolase